MTMITTITADRFRTVLNRLFNERFQNLYRPLKYLKPEWKIKSKFENEKSKPEPLKSLNLWDLKKSVVEQKFFYIFIQKTEFQNTIWIKF